MKFFTGQTKLIDWRIRAAQAKSDWTPEFQGDLGLRNGELLKYVLHCELRDADAVDAAVLRGKGRQ